MLKLVLAGLIALGAAAIPARAYTINGVYASLISCNYGYSAVRGESGYTGTYEAMGELFTVYFGPSYCEY